CCKPRMLDPPGPELHATLLDIHADRLGRSPKINPDPRKRMSSQGDRSAREEYREWAVRLVDGQLAPGVEHHEVFAKTAIGIAVRVALWIPRGRPFGSCMVFADQNREHIVVGGAESDVGIPRRLAV